MIGAVFISGCSMLRYQYSDRGRIEADRSSSASVESRSSSSSGVEIVDSSTVMTLDGSDDSSPLITEDNQIRTAAVLPESSSDVISSSSSSSDLPKPSAAPVSDLKGSGSPVSSSGSLSAADRSVIATSNSMIAKSYGAIPSGSLIYVEKVVCDPPLVYKTDALTSSVERSYADSGRFKMASAESVKRFRSNFEYQSVANNGDWGNLANLARSEKYDYVFYGAIGEQNGRKLLTYYLIKVSTGEIVWENTSTAG
jgi:PBP1b-binding outer membrane lipoprotein LpoB